MGSYVNVDDKYESPNDDGCTFSRRNLSLSFPGVAGPTGIAVRPELHIDRKRPAGRQLVRLSNTTDHGVTFDFSWAGGFAIDDGDLKIDASSSGDKKVSKADGWITTCEDVGPAGCRKQGPIRSPELSVVWEGLAGRRDSADAVHLENDESPDFDLKFKNINLKPGRVTYLMTWVVLNRSAKSARKFAVQLAHEPDWAFAGISKSTRKLIRNW
jgi:hypothetical protein